MKKLIYILLAAFVMACETDITTGLPTADPLIAFDAWLYHKAEPQTINVYVTNTYFDSSEPVGISGATVRVTNLNDPAETYLFSEDTDGSYVWNPTSPTDTFAVIGGLYYLTVDIDGTTYESVSELGDVPTIDSITWRFDEGDTFQFDSYFANFWARDFEGSGNTYWIKSWKNGFFLNKPSEINIAYDAAFSPDGNADGLIFIQPIRELINPFEFNDDDKLMSPFYPPFEVQLDTLGFDEDTGLPIGAGPVVGLYQDSIFVELNSISQEAYFWLEQVQIQTARPGGFGELFSVPLANIQSNIFSQNEDEKVVGIFCVSATSSMGKLFLEEDIRFTEE